MRLGLHLPQVGAPQLELLKKIALRAEAEGYASLWVSDHILVPAAGSDLPPIEVAEPVTTLAYVAAITTRIRLATSVLVLPYRSPIHLAKELATLDLLSEGRLVVGVASGWLESEFRALGANYPQRGSYTDEAVRLMRALWANSVPSFKGEFFTVENMRFGPRPQAGRIPIWIGGTSRRAIRRAIELGDGWHGTRMRPQALEERIRWLRELAARKGRSLDGFAITHRVYVGFADRWVETGGYVDGILAPPRKLAEYFNCFAELGVEELLITPLTADSDGLQRFLDCLGSEVRPQLASASA